MHIVLFVLSIALLLVVLALFFFFLIEVIKNGRGNSKEVRKAVVVLGAYLLVQVSLLFNVVEEHGIIYKSVSLQVSGTYEVNS